MGRANPLYGRSVLVVEDEPLIALDVHRTLRAAGASVLAATSLNDALELISYAEISAAILDVRLHGDDCTYACRALAKRNIPFVFHTGYSAADLVKQWGRVPLITKPARPEGIVSAVTKLLAPDTALLRP